MRLATRRARHAPAIIAAALLPIAIAGALVLPETIAGMIEQSITLSPAMPFTRNSPSTTLAGSASASQGR